MVNRPEAFTVRPEVRRKAHPSAGPWRHGADVWLCPTSRVGPVYRFVREGGGGRFNGPVGLLRPGGEVTDGPGTVSAAGLGASASGQTRDSD